MKPIVVFVHIHYAETWLALLKQIEETIRLPFRLFVTTTGRSGEIVLPTSVHLVDVVVIETSNRGRDVLPFLQAMERAGEFEIGLKLHGKRSVHRLDGDAWRDALVGSLLPSAEAVARLQRRFEGDERLGLVAPENSLCSIERHIGGNAASMAAVATRTGDCLADMQAHTPFFCAGTMFWFRRKALDRVASAAFTDLFVSEAGQTDGTVAHALERLFAALVEANGLIALPMDVALATDATVEKEELRAAARERVDIDGTFVRLPGPFAAFVMRRLRFAVPVYLALPRPVRRVIKAAASGTLALVKR